MNPQETFMVVGWQEVGRQGELGEKDLSGLRCSATLLHYAKKTCNLREGGVPPH